MEAPSLSSAEAPHPQLHRGAPPSAPYRRPTLSSIEAPTLSSMGVASLGSPESLLTALRAPLEAEPCHHHGAAAPTPQSATSVTTLRGSRSTAGAKGAPFECRSGRQGSAVRVAAEFTHHPQAAHVAAALRQLQRRLAVGVAPLGVGARVEPATAQCARGALHEACGQPRRRFARRPAALPPVRKDGAAAAAQRLSRLGARRARRVGARFG
eukprot:1721471-Prymnesium_polylepis.3